MIGALEKFEAYRKALIPCDKTERYQFFLDIAEDNFLRLKYVSFIFFCFEIYIMISTSIPIGGRTESERAFSWFLLLFHGSAFIISYLYRNRQVKMSGGLSQFYISAYCAVLMYWSVSVSLIKLERMGSTTLYIIAMTISSAIFYRRALVSIATNIIFYVYFVYGLYSAQILKGPLPGLPGKDPLFRIKMHINDSFLIMVICCILAVIIVKLRLEVFRDHKSLKELSFLDSMTRLLNHRKIHEVLGAEVQRASRYKRSLSAVMLDIDHFKNINDTYGHQFGDVVIKEIARILKEATRETDHVGRYGGEEFLVVLTDTDQESGFIFCERLRKKIEGIQFEKSVQITVSIGLKSYIDGETVEEIVADADEALYTAKKSGRNRTQIA